MTDTMAQSDQLKMAPIPASIEVTAKQALESAALPNLFPAGTRVYIADLGFTNSQTPARAAQRLRDLGYEPVPHIASRRITSKSALDERIARFAQEAGVTDVLVIGGGLTRSVGEFDSSMTVLESAILDRHGIENIGVAGHPEGNPDFSDDVAIEALRLKQAFGERTGAKVRIVTQFGFSPDRIIDWSQTLALHGIDLPVHLGVAGPARLTTLLKYAAMCGVGNSIEFLKKRALSLSALATNHSPESVVGPIENHWRQTPGTGIRQIHVFPFGGIEKSAEWLEARGSWRENPQHADYESN